MFAHLVDTHGATSWTRSTAFPTSGNDEASLRLRTGDPTVLAEYERRGRLHGGTSYRWRPSIIDAWHQARREARRWR
jgi:hypothetical protein